MQDIVHMHNRAKPFQSCIEIFISLIFTTLFCWQLLLNDEQCQKVFVKFLNLILALHSEVTKKHCTFSMDDDWSSEIVDDKIDNSMAEARDLSIRIAHGCENCTAE